MYSSFGGSRLKKLREKKAEEKRTEEQAKLEQAKLEQMKDKQDNKKIYLIAGAVAVLGAVIIIIKTRKK